MATGFRVEIFGETPNNETESSFAVSLAACAADDTAYLWIVWHGTQTLTTPGGWTKLGEVTDGSGPPVLGAMIRKRLTASDVTDGLTVSFSAGVSAIGVGAAYSGLDATTPEAQATLGTQADSSTSKATETVNFAVAGWCVSGFADRSGGTYTDLTDTLRKALVHSSSSSGVYQDSNADVAAGNQTRTATGPSTSTGVDFIMRLVEASGGGGGSPETLHATSLTAGAVATSGNALGAPDGTWTTDTGNTSWTARFALGDPVGSTASGTHSMTVRVRKELTQLGNPAVTSLTLFAGAASLGAIGAGNWSVTSSMGEDVTATFADTVLAGQDLSTIEVEIVTTAAGGSPTTRTAVQLDAVTWEGDFAAGQVTLEPDDSAHGHTSGSPTLTQVHEVAPAGSDHGHTGDAATLTQVHTLTADDSVHGHTSESPTLTAGGDGGSTIPLTIPFTIGGSGDPTLVPADSSHVHTATSPTLTQVHTLAPADSAHEHTADVGTLTQVHELGADDSVHGHDSAAPTLTQTHALTPADSTHAHTVDVATLTQTHEVSADGSVHGSTTTSPALTQIHELPPADSTHGHTSESPSLSAEGDLIGADTAHSHTSDSPALTQIHALTPASSGHSHGSDGASLTQVHALVPAGTVHAHSTGSPTLSVDTINLTPEDSTHGHTVDVAALAQVHALNALDSLHGHTSGTPTLTLGVLVTPPERTAPVPAESRVASVATEIRVSTIPAENRVATT